MKDAFHERSLKISCKCANKKNVSPPGIPLVLLRTFLLFACLRHRVPCTPGWSKLGSDAEGDFESPPGGWDYSWTFLHAGQTLYQLSDIPNAHKCGKTSTSSTVSCLPHRSFRRHLTDLEHSLPPLSAILTQHSALSFNERIKHYLGYLHDTHPEPASSRMEKWILSGVISANYTPSTYSLSGVIGVNYIPSKRFKLKP